MAFNYFHDTYFRNKKQTLVKICSIITSASTILSAYCVFYSFSQSDIPVKRYYYYSHFIEGMWRPIEVQELTFGPTANKRSVGL